MVVYVFPGEWVDVAAEQIDVLKTGVFLCPVKCEDPAGDAGVVGGLSSITGGAACGIGSGGGPRIASLVV